MTLATDLFLRLSKEEAFLNGAEGALKGFTGALSNVFDSLVKESPSLKNFFPAGDEIAGWNLAEDAVTFNVGGYHFVIESLGLLNAPIEEDDENRLFLMIDVIAARENADLPLIATLGLSDPGAKWVEFLPETFESVVAQEVASLEEWFEGFIRAAILEHKYLPGSFGMDEEELVDFDLIEDVHAN